MFSLVPGTKYYQYVGLGILLLQIALFWFGLPPFHYGIWLQTEPHMVALFSLATLDSIWLLFGIMRGKLALRAMPKVWYALMAWVGWQFIPTLFAQTPHRSWFGPVEMGEGVAWHIVILLIVTKVIPLWQDKRLRNVIVLWAGFIISMEAVLHVLFNSRVNVYVPGVWIPAQWADYMGFMAAFFWIIVMLGDYVRKPLVFILLTAFSIAVVIASYNNTAIALVPLAALISGIMMLLRHYNISIPFLQPRKHIRILVMMLVLVPWAWVIFCIQYDPPPFDPNQEESLFSLQNKNTPLGSRIGLTQVGWEAMKHEPSRWLIGAGWGNYNETIFQYSLLDGVHMYYKGTRQPNWLFVDGNAYHTHSQPMEALIAMGLPGVILFFLIPFMVIWTIPARYFWPCIPMYVAFYTLTYLWFELPQCVPMYSLMMGAICLACSEGLSEERKRPGGKSLMALTACVIVMILTVQEQYRGMMWGHRVYAGSHLADPKEFPLEYMLRDLYRGGDRTRVAGMGFALALDRERGDIDMRQHDWYKKYLDISEQMTVSPTIGPRGKHLRLWLQYKLLLNLGYPIFQDLGDRAVANMHNTLLSVARAAPLRDDVASFYFLNLPVITDNNKELQIRLLRDVLEVVPNHRSALWLLGHLLMERANQREEGLAMIHRAVEMGVEKVYPITDEQLAPYQ